MQRKANSLGPEDAAIGVNTKALMPNLSDPAWKSNWERKDPVSGARDKKLFTGG